MKGVCVPDPSRAALVPRSSVQYPVGRRATTSRLRTRASEEPSEALRSVDETYGHTEADGVLTVRDDLDALLEVRVYL